MRKVILYAVLISVTVFLIQISGLTRGALSSGLSTIYVKSGSAAAGEDGSFERPFSSVSQALASAADNAKIFIASGSYRESLRIAKPVHLYGEPNPPTIIIGSLSEAQIIRFEASGSLENVTLIPDQSQAVGPDTELPIGIAVRKGAKTVEINGCTIDSCSVGLETAACDASVMINGCTLIRNHYGIGAVLTSGMMYCANSQITDSFTGVFSSEADVHLFYCNIVNNRHGVHVGIRYKADIDSRVVLEGNKIENNLVTGVWFDQGTPELRTSLDLGGGGWSSGKNEIGDNMVYDIFNDTRGARIPAQNNAFRTRRFANLEATSKIDLGDADTSPPGLKVEITPQSLITADRRMVPIHATLSAWDDSGSTPLIVLSSIASDQPQSNTEAGDLPTDVSGNFYRSADTDFELRAEITQGKASRSYFITYVATDQSGNSSAVSTTVSVVR